MREKMHEREKRVGKSVVREGSAVRGRSAVRGKSAVKGRSAVTGNSAVRGGSIVKGNSVVRGRSERIWLTKNAADFRAEKQCLSLARHCCKMCEF